jgi:hypothetical protein
MNSLFLYQLASGQRRRKKTEVDAADFLINSCQNRLLYWFSLKKRKKFNQKVHKLIEDIALAGEKEKRKLRQTIKLIDKISKENNLDYILAKLDRTLPYISCDLDLLVFEKDVDSWLDVLKNEGYRVRSHKTFLRGHAEHKSLTRAGFYKIDLTTQFDWQKKIYFDLNFLWSGYDKKTHRMGKEADFLVNLATIIFKRMSFNLLDYLYLKKLENQGLNWRVIRDQVGRHRWSKAYQKAFSLYSSLNPEVDDFPKPFPLKIYLAIFREKVKNKEFSLNFFVYISLARLRHYFFRKKYLPYHVFWYPYEKLNKIKKEKIKI